MAENLDKKIRDLNREILRLKTAHPVASNMLTFYSVFNWDADQDFKNHSYEITYVQGEQPILTIVGFSYAANTGAILFGEPEGNKQMMYDTNGYHEEGDTFGLLSTRQILGIRKIS